MSGDNRQQWGYSHFNQAGHETGPGNFVNPAYGPAGNDMNNHPFSVPQQWQPQDHHFIQGNGYPSYQSQGQGYPVQNFSAENPHVQDHQHPPAYSAPISIDGQQDVSWDYDFGFDTNPLAGMGDSLPFGSALAHGPQANALPSPFPQDMASTGAPQQHQFMAEPSPGHFFAPSHVPSDSRNPQQRPPQAMVQQVNQRQAVDYQQPNINQLQQPAANHSQHSNPLLGAGQQPNQSQNMNMQQQVPRIGTPQSTSSTPQPRQSPFSGHQVPPLSMQQAQFSSQNGRGSPAIPFSSHQQMNVSHAQPSPSNGPTTQTRFMPPQAIPAQRQMLPSPTPVTNIALSNLKPKVQQSIQPYVQPAAQPAAQPNIQPKAAVPVATPPVYQHTSAGGLAPPRVIRRDDSAIPSARSRYVGFTYAPTADLEGGVEEERPIGDIKDPNEIDDKLLARYFPGPNGQVRPLASSIVQDWSRAMESDDSAGQTEQEQLLKQHLGGAIPNYYEEVFRETKAAKEKASRKPGPKRNKTRPADEADAAEWDAIGVVYLPSPQPTGAEIGAAVAAYGKLIRGLTAEFQAMRQKLKSAKETDAAAWKEKVARRLEIIYRAVEGANKWGDRQVLANLGGNQKLISDFVTCLIHANNSADHNGKAAKGVLRLMSEVTTVEKDFLMTNLQFAKISKKFEHKGDAEVKELVKKIKENVVSREEASKNGLLDVTDAVSAPDPASSVKSTSTSSSTVSKSMSSSDAAKKKVTTTAVTKTPLALSSVKRPRDEESDTKPVKRLAAEPSAAQASQPSQKAASSKVVIPAPNPTAATQSKLFLGIGMLGAKAKPASKTVTKAVPAKPDTTTKLEAKKEPGLAKLDASRARKMEPLKDDVPPTSKLGGIGALLEEISKPKPAGRVTPEKESMVKKDETQEEKDRRLKKERRRHLRVSWKEGDELTEVRVFHKDIAEDEGRASNMIRDARDDRSEGMVLRQGLKGGAQLDDEDEEDELPYRPWFEPPGIDFAILPQDQREKNFVTCGGLVDFETEQQKLIAERENKELMVIYTDPSDIPPTPKSPHSQPQEDTDMQSGTVEYPGELVLAFGSPLGLQDSVSLGVISAVNRQLDANSPMVYLQTDAAINPGNSGGPLVNMQGDLVGVNSMIESKSGGNEGLGFSIPSNTAKRIYDQLIHYGHVRRGVIGISPINLDRTLAEGLGLSRDSGVLVEDVEPDSPAAEAGVRPGDILTTLDGKPLRDIRQIAVQMFQQVPGEVIHLGILNGQETRSVDVTVSEASRQVAGLFDPAKEEQDLVPRLGVLVVPVDAEVAKSLDGQRQPGGLVVIAKTFGVAAEAVGLEVGDIVYSANKTKVDSVQALKVFMENLKPGAPVVLQVERDSQLNFVAFRFEE